MTIKSNIFLCGFMGSGKTTIGRSLAPLLDKQFFDLDQMIEQKSGITVPEIFAKNGEKYFREIEKQMLLEFSESRSGSLLALGGGSLQTQEIVDRLRAKGLLIYIQLPVQELRRRLSLERNTRPLLKDLQEKEMEAAIGHLLKEREKFYLQADLIVPGMELDPAWLQQQIREKTV